MEVEVVEQQENKLLNRVEVRFTVRHDEGGTPTRQAVREALQAALKVKDRPLVVDHIKTSFGKREAQGYAKVYESLEAAARVERRHVLQRNGLLEGEA